MRFSWKKILLLAVIAAIAIPVAVALANTTLASHTGQVGATWTQHPSSTGASEITSGGWLRNSTTGATSVYTASGSPVNANYTVEADYKAFSLPSTTNVGVIGRASTSATTFYTCRYYSANGAWELWKFVAGTSTKLGNTNATLSTGNTYHIKLTMNGSAISCDVDGVTKASATDSAITAAGKPGLRIYSSTVGDSSGPQLDNFTATDL